MQDDLLIAKKIVSAQIRIAVFVSGIHVSVEQNCADQEIAATADQSGPISTAHIIILAHRVTRSKRCDSKFSATPQPHRQPYEGVDKMQRPRQRQADDIGDTGAYQAALRGIERKAISQKKLFSQFADYTAHSEVGVTGRVRRHHRGNRNFDELAAPLLRLNLAREVGRKCGAKQPLAEQERLASAISGSHLL